MNEINPNYYNRNNIEVIDIIKSYNLDFFIGNVLKYILRAKFKKNGLNELLDLKKALNYLKLKINKLESIIKNLRLKNNE